MIVMSLCQSCLQPYQLMIEPNDIPLIKQIASEDGQQCPCPRLCGGTINLVGDPGIAAMTEKLREPMHIGGKDLYKAVNGLGLPDEVPKDVDVIESLFKANTITGVLMEKLGNTFYLHELKLSNGITVHLTAGPQGSAVLKVTKEAVRG